MVRMLIVVCCLLVGAVAVEAREVAGVTLAEEVQAADGTTLTLNGAGVRSKLFFKIYVAALYLEHPATEVAPILTTEGHRRMEMHFLYDKVEKGKLVEAWNEGFAGNVAEAERQALAERISRFNEMFGDVKKGETIVLDYVPGKGTSVSVAGGDNGVVEGRDFSDALLAIWLGDKPVTEQLKKELLGGSK